MSLSGAAKAKLLTLLELNWHGRCGCLYAMHLYIITIHGGYVNQHVKGCFPSPGGSIFSALAKCIRLIQKIYALRMVPIANIKQGTYIEVVNGY
jgi:hypothetical protein